jgi:hypothetical protein
VALGFALRLIGFRARAVGHSGHRSFDIPLVASGLGCGTNLFRLASGVIRITLLPVAWIILGNGGAIESLWLLSLYRSLSPLKCLALYGARLAVVPYDPLLLVLSIHSVLFEVRLSSGNVNLICLFLKDMIFALCFASGSQVRRFGLGCVRFRGILSN